MIQRIQSIFLFIASGGAFTSFIDAFNYFTINKEVISNSASPLADGDYDINDNTILLTLIILTGIVALVSIFLYNNRKLQLNITKLVIVLGIGLAITAGGLFYQVYSSLNIEQSFSAGIGFISPALVIIFGILAHIYINKDEKLVRSMDRLR